MAKTRVSAAASAGQRDAGELDLWAPVSTAELPGQLVDAVESADWPRAKLELQRVMDGITTDGAYGRALLQLVRLLPIGYDPVFDRYRAAVAVDYGDWDVLVQALAAAPVESREIEGLREILLAPSSANAPRPNSSPEAAPYNGYEYMLSALPGWFRRWARQLPRWDAKARWARPDVPVERHLRIRQLHHQVMLAAGEASAGRLDVAVALADAGRSFGDTGEPLVDLAHDLRIGCAFAMGEASTAGQTRLFVRAAQPNGLSPLGTLEFLLHLNPFFWLYEPGFGERAARLMSKIAARLASPRAQLQAHAWLVAASARERPIVRREVLALLAQARHAGPGLRVLPELLFAVSTRRFSDFALAEARARQVGCVWAQVASLVHLVALDPGARRNAQSLIRLLSLTGWRRPPLVESDVAADSALGLAANGFRGTALMEFALATGRATCAVEVAARHAQDETLRPEMRRAGLEALFRLGTSHARGVLALVARGTGETASSARGLLATAPRTVGLTDREVQVIDLAGRGLTNRQIGDYLSLSPHTVARHLVNARDKLGAANRADAAVRLGRLVDR
ncbi:MAG TPA: helix-turn-helix transcriptional regulator [Candidatus Limnocylindria bacterium]|nr:helix-turn-helix transcriptional regulator [Candidatus Limnocylindria bacterium]